MNQLTRFKIIIFLIVLSKNATNCISNVELRKLPKKASQKDPVYIPIWLERPHQQERIRARKNYALGRPNWLQNAERKKNR